MNPLRCFLASAVLLTLPLFAAESFHGRIERFDPAFDRLVATDAKVEQLADGIQWAEGPVWYQGALVLSDPPANIAYRWTPGATKLEKFLEPSGGAAPATGFREAGSNGLMLDRQGRLLLCQDGTRRIARYENGQFTPVVERYNGKRFSSPNDLAVRKNGEIYFTDPPYGLDGLNRSPLREQPVNGVYRVGVDGKVSLVIDSEPFPNGLAFSPDEKVLYVADSEEGKSRLTAYDVQPDGSVKNGRRFYDTHSSPHFNGVIGWFDGFKVDEHGNIWTSAPGGIAVITPDAKLLGRIFTGVPTANCAFAPDGYLYITANHLLLRVKTQTKDATM